MPNRDQGNTDWRRGVVRQGKTRIMALPRPEGCSPQRWHCVVRLLLAVAEHLPDPFPRQENLARGMGVGLRTVKRWVAWAVEFGVLEVVKEPSYHGHWEHNSYRLSGISTGGHIGPSSGGHNGTRTGGHSGPLSSLYQGIEKGENTLSECSQEGSFPPPSGRRKEVSMSDYDPDFSRGVSDDHPDPPRPRSRERPVKRTAVGQVTHHFRQEWDKLLHGPGGGSLAMMVLFDSVAAFQSRIKTDCFEREGHSVAEVNASIDRFLHQVAVRRELPKPGQPVWKLWWNRRSQYPGTVISEPVYYPDWKRRMALDDPGTET